VKPIEIKAADPDNEVELKGIVELFKSAYGEHFPNRCVYSTAFWNKHMIKRFTSLIALQERRIVGHLAIQPDHDNPHIAQLLFPAYARDMQGALLDLSGQAWELIERQSARRGWRLVYACEFDGLPLLQEVTSGVFRTSPVAILPDYYRSDQKGLQNGSRRRQRERAPRRAALVLTAKAFKHGRDPIEAPLTLFVPKRHAPMCEYLYSPLGLQRSFADGFDAKRMEPYALPAEARAVERFSAKEAEVSRFFVHPSLLKNTEAAAAEIAANTKRGFVFVNMRDPSCPLFCSRLEENGYLFCGVFPLIRNRESIVYFHPGSEHWLAEGYCCARAETLGAYISAQETQLELPTLGALGMRSRWAADAAK
jgi:hypothetical protein